MALQRVNPSAAVAAEINAAALQARVEEFLAGGRDVVVSRNEQGVVTAQVHDAVRLETVARMVEEGTKLWPAPTAVVQFHFNQPTPLLQLRPLTDELGRSFGPLPESAGDAFVVAAAPFITRLEVVEEDKLTRDLGLRFLRVANETVGIRAPDDIDITVANEVIRFFLRLPSAHTTSVHVLHIADALLEFNPTRSIYQGCLIDMAGGRLVVKLRRTGRGRLVAVRPVARVAAAGEEEEGDEPPRKRARLG